MCGKYINIVTPPSPILVDSLHIPGYATGRNDNRLDQLDWTEVAVADPATGPEVASRSKSGNRQPASVSGRRLRRALVRSKPDFGTLGTIAGKESEDPSVSLARERRLHMMLS